MYKYIYSNNYRGEKYIKNKRNEREKQEKDKKWIWLIKRLLEREMRKKRSEGEEENRQNGDDTKERQK